MNNLNKMIESLLDHKRWGNSFIALIMVLPLAAILIVVYVAVYGVMKGILMFLEFLELPLEVRKEKLKMLAMVLILALGMSLISFFYGIDAVRHVFNGMNKMLAFCMCMAVFSLIFNVWAYYYASRKKPVTEKTE